MSATITGHIVGNLWWPVGYPAHIPFTFTIPDDRDSLAAAVEDAIARNDGDFSTAGMLTADTVLIVTHHGRHGTTHEHVREVTTLPSLSGLVDSDYFAGGWCEE